MIEPPLLNQVASTCPGLPTPGVELRIASPEVGPTLLCHAVECSYPHVTLEGIASGVVVEECLLVAWFDQDFALTLSKHCLPWRTSTKTLLLEWFIPLRAMSSWSCLGSMRALAFT